MYILVKMHMEIHMILSLGRAFVCENTYDVLIAANSLITYKNACENMNDPFAGGAFVSENTYEAPIAGSSLIIRKNACENKYDLIASKGLGRGFFLSVRRHLGLDRATLP